jgi:DNA-binding LacI/PurR family transcriptional regulator
VWLALFAIEWLYARGLRVPDDVSVIGFDGVPKGGDVIAGVATVQQPFQEMAARAVSAILEGAELIDWAVLPLKLVVRGSTGPAPG